MHRFVLLLPLAPVLLLNETSNWALLALVAIVFAALVCMAEATSLRHVGSRCTPALLAASAVLLLLLLQLIPLAPQALTYPIWKSAADALGTDLGNRISLDPAATVQSMLRLLFLSASLMAVAGGSIDRSGARLVYRMMALGACVLCVFLLGYRQLDPTKFAWGTILDAIGPIILIIGTSLILHRREDVGNQLVDVAVGASAVILAVIVLATEHRTPIVMLALGGTVLMAASYWLPAPKLSRRLPLAVAALLTLALAATSFSSPWLHGFSTERSRVESAVTPATVDRMLSDVPLLGTGAGTFSSLARIYNPGTGDSVLPPSLITKFEVEFGPLGTLVLGFVWFALALELLAGAFRRNRDRYFCASAAAIACIGALESLFDVGWSQAPVQALVAMSIAIGLAQRDSSIR